jgi:hypothetical protein
MNDVTKKIVDSIKDFDDLKEYSNAQYATIVAQSKKITELERKLEACEAKLIKAEQSNIVASSLNPDQENKGSDAETICLIQLALLCGAAKNGELTLEETKKVEIYAKTLQLLRGKPVEDKKKQNTGKALSNEDLLKLMNSALEQ